MKEKNHITVGTAGHVDHGKTMLTAALTGIDTDRLPEEKRRGMTIVPGFVPLDLKSGRRLGLIDVPGHEKFVKNMLAGVGGIDMVMLIVAADEGIMPQTVEHLNILHLLGIDKGVIVITKKDLVDDEWLGIIQDQIKELISSTNLKNAPIVPVSAATGQNIEQLREILDAVSAKVEEKPCSGYCRLPIDRVFSKAGFGTIVTGTLWMGKIVSGQKLQLMPKGREVRVRGLQVHGEAVDEAFAGQRTAINLAGINTNEVVCGSWLAEPGLLRQTFRIDISLSLLSSAKPLTQRARVRLHHGTAEVLGRINLLDIEELEPGKDCLAQLMLEKPLFPLRDDRLIIRAYSPVITIGGATVLDPVPQRHKRFDENVLSELAKKNECDRGETILDLVRQSNQPISIEDIAHATQMMRTEIDQYINEFMKNGCLTSIIIDTEAQYILSEQKKILQKTSINFINDYHKKYPLRKGIPVAELRQRIFPAYHIKQLSAFLNKWQNEGLITVKNATVCAADFECRPNKAQEKELDNIMQTYETAGFSPPEWKVLIKKLSINQNDAAEYLIWLFENGKLIKTGDIFYSTKTMHNAEIILRELYQKSYFTIGEARDTLLTSRKFTQNILEYLDAKKITLREGDKRRFII